MSRTTNSMGKIIWGIVREGWPKPGAHNSKKIKGDGGWGPSFERGKSYLKAGDNIRHVITRTNKNGELLMETVEVWHVDRVYTVPSSWDKERESIGEVWMTRTHKSQR